MVGGGNRRDEGSMPIQNTNLFAALDTRRKKKKSSSDKSKGRQDPVKEEPEPQVFWSPTPLKAKAWADIDSDDEDDDYFATTAPPKALWSASEASRSDAKEVQAEESESEEDILDEGDDEDDDDLEEEHETQVHPEAEPEVKKAPEVPAPPKEPERQLSKKELKQKELAEFEALLADFGIAPKENNGGQDNSQDKQEKKEANGEGEKKENAGGESKASKKKKKKNKQKEVKESQDEVKSNSDAAAAGESVEQGEEEEASSSMDIKERLKKLASMKKKKSSKETDAGAKVAAQEAAARKAKLAAEKKKKEKSHYNQQPVRFVFYSAKKEGNSPLYSRRRSKKMLRRVIGNVAVRRQFQRALSSKSGGSGKPSDVSAAVDSMLLRSLKEHYLEVSKMTPPPKVTPPSPFEIVKGSLEGTGAVLKKSVGNEEISLFVMRLAHGGGDDEDEDGINQLFLHVAVSKPNQAESLHFLCGLYPDALGIHSVSMRPKLEDLELSDDPARYTGPSFEELDEKMRDVFHSFLEERGVNESLFPFLQAWLYVKDHRNLLRWFKSVGTYVHENPSAENA